MRHLALVGAVAAVALTAAAFSGPALAAQKPPSESDIETLLVCPTCHETLDESNSAVAQQMKAGQHEVEGPASLSVRYERRSA